MRSASSITVRMPRSSMSRMVKTPMPARTNIFFFDGVDVAHAHQHAILRLHLGREVEDVASSDGHSPMMAASGMPCTLPLGEVSGVLMSVCASIQIKSDSLVLTAIKFGNARDRAGSHGMISAKRQRNLAGFQRLEHQFRMLGAGGRDLFQIFGVGVAFLFLLRDGDGDVAAVFHFVAERFEPGFQSGHADGGRAHVDAAAGLAEVKGNADDANFSGSDVVGGRSGHVIIVSIDRTETLSNCVIVIEESLRTSHFSIPQLLKFPNYSIFAYGYSRYSILGNGIVSRTCSRPQIQATARSMPMPKPPCGTLPNLRRSRYHLNASSGKLCS